MEFKKIENQLKASLEKCTHVVIKLGTGVLNPFIESTDFAFFKKLANEILFLQEKGKKVLIVSSGAVGFGKKIRLKKISDDQLGNSIVDKQAYAALGQSFLIDTYREYLEKVGLDVAQILLTPSDFKSRRHFQNMKRTLDQLLDWGSVPIINENDTVAIDEKFGDNDTLSAMITGMYQQSCLIILTTIDGYYLNNAKMDVLSDIETLHMKSAGGASKGGIGGMRTKLLAARKIIQSGQIMNISPGKEPEILRQIITGSRVGTWFVPQILEPVSAKKRWLLHHHLCMGELIIDEGARKALVSTGASLLVVGVKKYNGEFSKGDVISICGLRGETIGIGTASVSSMQLKTYMAENTSKKGIEIIHRDNLAMLSNK